MARFRGLINLVEKQINDTSVTTQVKQWINQAQDEIQVFFPWPFLLIEAFIQTVAVHTTGTGSIGVTTGSKDVTGTSTAWTAAMTGRKFRVTGDNEWYTFTRVTAESGTLDRNYEGAVATAADYRIYQDVYRAHGDVNQLKLMRDLGHFNALEYASNTEIDRAVPSTTIESNPRIIVPIGRGIETYTTGTIETTAGSAVVEGDDTAWTTPERLDKGLKMIIGNFSYTIKSVDSATQITLYQLADETNAATTTYIINRNNIKFQLYPAPDTSIGMPYKYFRNLPPLVNDGDESEIPEKYHRLLVEGALKRAFMYQFDVNKYSLAKAEFNEGLLLMKSDFRQTVDKVNVFRSDDSILHPDVFRPHFPSNLGSL